MTDQRIEIDPLKMTWDILRERASKKSDLSTDQQRDAVAAYDILERIFGTSYFDKKHTLFFFFIDRASWRCEWAIWFARFVQSLEHHPDFSSLVQDLKNPQLYDERMTILKVVEFLLSSGFTFRLDSPIIIKNVPKKPDILVQLDSADPGFFIEVTRLGVSEKQREADRAFEELWGIRFMLCPLENCSGHLERTPTLLELQELKQHVQTTMKKVETGTGFETFEIHGLIKFACTREVNDERLKQWATDRNMEVAQLSMAGIHVDEFKRIYTKLSEKIKQVPTDRSNVIVVYPHLFALPPRDSMQFSAFIKALETIVFKHSHIGYVILIFSWTGGNNNEVIRYRDHICVNRRWLYFNCNSIMLIKNRFASKPMMPAIEENFLRAFTEGDGQQLSE